MKKTYEAVVERDPDTGSFVGYVPGVAGTHSRGAILDELQRNRSEVVATLNAHEALMEEYDVVFRKLAE